MKRDRDVENEQKIICLEGNGTRPSHNGIGWSDQETMYTLNSTEIHAVAYEIHKP